MRTIYRLYYIIRDFNWQMTKKNISAFAASTAFFLFLSMIPLLMALCAIRSGIMDRKRKKAVDRKSVV